MPPLLIANKDYGYLPKWFYILEWVTSVIIKILCNLAYRILKPLRASTCYQLRFLEIHSVGFVFVFWRGVSHRSASSHKVSKGVLSWLNWPAISYICSLLPSSILWDLSENKVFTKPYCTPWSHWLNVLSDAIDNLIIQSQFKSRLFGLYIFVAFFRK